MRNDGGDENKGGFMVRFIFLAILTSFIFAHDIDVTLDFKHSSGGSSSERKKYFARELERNLFTHFVSFIMQLPLSGVSGAERMQKAK